MLLRIQDRILLSLAFLGDLFEDLADAGGIMSASYKQVYGFTPRKYKRNNFVAAVKYGLRTERIEKVIKKNRPYLRLTGKGKNKLMRDFPLACLQKRKWDGFWRVLPYDIKEIKRGQRDQLRRKLYELGFKQFQKSVYFSPHPIEKEMADFLKTLKLEGKIQILLCNKILGVENRELAKKLWHLDKLNKEYKKLLFKLERLSTEKKLREAKAKYLELLTADPFLPKELLPRPWWGEEAGRELKKILRKK